MYYIISLLARYYIANPFTRQKNVATMILHLWSIAYIERNSELIKDTIIYETIDIYHDMTTKCNIYIRPLVKIMFNILYSLIDLWKLIEILVFVYVYILN